MKKISFNERYGLQQAVLDGTKTMTRRIVPESTLRMAKMEVSIHGGDLADRIKDHSLYLWRDEVAIAQSYKSIVEQDPDNDYGNYYIKQFMYTSAWTNKMFVRADLMPHRIRITNIRVERLQDITDEDCMKEGIIHVKWRQYLKQDIDDFSPPPYKDHDIWTLPMYEEGFLDAWAEQKQGEYAAESARIAFAVLINRISGRGTWERNPWVYVYGFELIK